MTMAKIERNSGTLMFHRIHYYNTHTLLLVKRKSTVKETAKTPERASTLPPSRQGQERNLRHSKQILRESTAGRGGRQRQRDTHLHTRSCT